MSYLETAKKAEQEQIQVSQQDDPILATGQWYPEFHRFHVHVVQ